LIVERDATVRREGNNIISKHYVTLGEAMLGCDVTINMVSGQQKKVSLKYIRESGYQHTISG
jgi:DnaJ-class molecular chaperone